MADKPTKADPFQQDKGAEEMVQKMGEAKIHPVVEKIQHKFGFLNLVRNKRNRDMIDANDPESIQ